MRHTHSKSLYLIVRVFTHDTCFRGCSSHHERQALKSVATRSLSESKLELGVNESKVVEVRSHLSKARAESNGFR